MLIKRVFVFLMLCILLSPTVFMLMGIEIGKPVRKGSVQAPSADKLEMYDKNMDYFIDLGKWFSANHALEGFYVRLWNQLRWSFFGVSDELVHGIDGWEVDKKSVFEQLPDSDKTKPEEIQRTVTLIKRLQNYLHERDIGFLLVVIPFKSTIYPDKYEKAGVPARSVTGLSKFQHAFKLNDIPFVDAESVLLKNKDKGVYYKTDLHFNTLGAFLVAREILYKLYEHFDMNSPEIPEPEHYLSTFSGGSASIAMPLIYEMTEQVPTVNVQNSYEQKNEVIQKSSGQIIRYLSKRNDISLLPSSIIFGNSFMILYPHVGFANYFKKLSATLDYQEFKNILDIIEDDTKMVILQIYETQLLFHLPHGNNYGYWDKRVYDLPLPEGFSYKE